MRVAVIGGGLFGCTAAAHAARAGHEVHLFEAKPKLMQGATSCCYYRLHQGYHYPRSPETGRESLAAEASFRAEYGKAVIDGGQQYYAVHDGAKVTGLQFQGFMEHLGLWHRRIDRHPLVRAEWVFEVKEPRIDAALLGFMATDAVEDAGVHLHLGRPVGKLDGFDRAIVAAYAGTNQILKRLGLPQMMCKFQVVEKPIVALPAAFANTSIVVMDQCCIDPHQYTDCHVLGHVSATFHHEHVGLEPLVPLHLLPYVERGVVRERDGFAVSRIGDVVRAMGDVIPAVRGCEYMGSMYAVRALLDGQEATDARPTMVRQLNEQVVQIFSGKLGTAVVAAQQAVAMLDDVKAEAA
jgi:glycine/D-amino acid oxidase-like deaminating enzyme